MRKERRWAIGFGVAGTEVEVFTGRGSGDSGIQFGMGERYLVYAYRSGDKLATNMHPPLDQVSTTCGSGWVDVEHAIFLLILNADG